MEFYPEEPFTWVSADQYFRIVQTYQGYTVFNGQLKLSNGYETMAEAVAFADGYAERMGAEE